MSDLKHTCPHCNGHIAFPSEAVGIVVQCPHCANQTVLSAPGYANAQPELEPLPPKPLHEAVGAEEHTSDATLESTSEGNWWATVIAEGVFAAFNVYYFTYNLMWVAKNTETYLWMFVQFMGAAVGIGAIFVQTLHRKILPIGFAITGLSLIIGGAVGFFSISSSERNFMGYAKQVAALSEIESRAIDPMGALEGKTDEELRVILRDTVIPNYENFFTKLQEIPADSEEIRTLHSVYLDGAQQYLNGLRGMEQALSNQDGDAFGVALEMALKGRQKADDSYVTQFNGLGAKYGLQ